MILQLFTCEYVEIRERALVLLMLSLSTTDGKVVVLYILNSPRVVTIFSRVLFLRFTLLHDIS
jgi:hypothetical protein